MGKDNRLGQEDNLPTTRWQLLGDSLRYRFWDFLSVSLLTFVFWIPSFTWLIFCSLSDLLDFTNFNSVLMVYGLNVLGIMIGGIGMAGLFYFSRKMVWGEGASLPGDFFEGIKKNASMFLIVYFLIGLLYLILRLDLCALQANSGFSGWGLGALEGLSYAIFFLFLLALFFVQTQSAIYADSFFHLAANGFKFLFGAFLTNVPMFLAFFALFLLFEFVPFPVAMYLTIGLEAIFYFGFSAFFFTEYSYYLFDKSINLRQYPQLLRKGLGHKEGYPHDDQSV
jgi:hypothetical protein